MVSSMLIDMKLSSSTISKSGKHNFSITLCATTDTNESIVIDPFWTMLDPKMLVFDYPGFTFENAQGRHAERTRINVNYLISDVVSYTAAIEIPPLNAKPFAVTHKIEYKSCERGDEEYRRMVNRFLDQTAGLEIGETYEIGLGTYWNSASWWRTGRKWWVFGWHRTLPRRTAAAPLPLILRQKQKAMVVE